ncbi:MAG: TonB-dependent receptor [Bacteroidota bacterium]|nr:TonB-dependent receptor [Bacteroidota bacterium]
MCIKKLLLLFIISILCVSGFSQPPGGGDRPAIGSLSGKVLDSKSKLPVEFSTIALFRRKDSNLVTGTVATEKGEFILSQLEYGRYFMRIDFIGYKQIVLDSIAIKPGNPEVLLGVINLVSSAEQLGEVEVAEEKSTMQLGIDRKIFNVEKSIVSEGGSATDVLQNIPSVSVDIDGNVSLRGSGNITVLIDGKPSGITGTSRAAILQQIPASSIESIELITNPSAKYDPDGMSGIINIVLKKNKLSGFNGSVSAGIGTNDKYNGALNISYRNSKLNVYANYGYRENSRYGSGLGHRQNLYPDTTFFLDQNSEGRRKNTSHNIKAGLDLYLNERNTIGGSVLYNVGDDKNYDKTFYREGDENNITSGTYTREVNEMDESIALDYNLNYRKTFKKPKQELMVDATLSNSGNSAVDKYNESEYALKYDGNNAFPFRQTTGTEDQTTVTTIMADYVHPLKGQKKLEAGLKTIIRDITTDFVSQNYDYSIPDFLVDTNLSNEFNFNENIYSAYATFSGAIKRTGYQLGLRAEEAQTKSNQVTSGEVYRYNYFNLFPSLHISQKLNKEQELQLSYTRRINRPGMRSLNPFKDYSDPYNIRYGNPFLKPEYINSYELSYVKYWKKGVVTATAYYRKTDGIIQRIKTLSDSVTSFITFQNLNSSTSYGFELISKNDITKWWNTTTSVNIFQTVIDGNNVQGDLQNENFSYIIKVLSNMKILKNLDIQFTANYMGPTATAQGEVKPIFSMDLGFKKEIFKNASLSLNITDLTDSRKFYIIASDPTFYQEMERKRESRVATLTFSYRFGKLSENTRKNRKANTGEFEGGGGDMGM